VVVIAVMRGAPTQSPSCWGTVPVELAEVKLDGEWRGIGFGMEGEEVSVATVSLSCVVFSFVLPCVERDRLAVLSAREGIGNDVPLSLDVLNLIVILC
jgi:hypothetical protein